MAYESLRVITELDAARIRGLGVDVVEQEADIVPGSSIPPDVVTVNSTVSFRDEPTGSIHRVTVVYPAEMSIGRRRISVLSPVGAALLGKRAGSVAEVALPDGTRREIHVLEVHYQPEASGHFAR